MNGALFVARQDVLDLLLAKHGIVDRQYRAAGVAKDMLDILVRQSAQNDFRAG